MPKSERSDGEMLMWICFKKNIKKSVWAVSKESEFFSKLGLLHYFAVIRKYFAKFQKKKKVVRACQKMLPQDGRMAGQTDVTL